MHKRLVAPILILMAVHSATALSQAPPEPVSGTPMNRDVFLVLMKSKMNDACDAPQSPFACMVKNIEVCRAKLPIAVDQCHKKMKVTLPEELKPEDRKQWSRQVGRCIVDNYILLAGADNIDMSRCPGKKNPANEAGPAQ